MKKSYFLFHGQQVNKTEAWVVFQSLCDEVFGEGIVDIAEVSTNNAVLMHLMFLDKFEAFYENLKALLSSLKEKMESKDAMDQLIKTVEKVADPYDGEQAYAQLVTWDVLWDLFDNDIAKLDGFAVDVMYDTEEVKRANELAYEHKHMVLEKFYDDLINGDKHIAVLVKAPWNDQKCCDNDGIDFLYYRSVVRRDFMEYDGDDETELYDILDDYYGDELVSDAIKQLNGVIVIDMVGGKEKDQVICHAFKNPNSEAMTPKEDMALLGSVLQGDKMGIYDDFEWDNY